MASKKSRVRKDEADAPQEQDVPLFGDLALSAAMAAADEIALQHGHMPYDWLAPGEPADDEPKQALNDLAAYVAANPGLDGEVYYRQGAALGVHGGATHGYFELPVWARLAYNVFAGTVVAVHNAMAKELKLADEAEMARRAPAPNPIAQVPIEDTILEREADPLALNPNMRLGHAGQAPKGRPRIDDPDAA